MNTTLQEYLDLIETRLDIKGMLNIYDNKIIPRKKLLTKSYIKKTHTDDLFEYMENNLYFSKRFLNLSSEITDKKLMCEDCRYLELRNK
jgi:hypothetical protein